MMKATLTRRQMLATGAAFTGATLAGLPARAQEAGDPVRKIILYSDVQGARPQSFQAAQLIAQAWRQVGLDVETRPTPSNQFSQIVWFDRTRWDTSMWTLAGRADRSDPDEFIFSLFHSSTAAGAGYNLVGYSSAEYDQVAAEQRAAIDLEQRKSLVRKAQEILNRDQPCAFLVHKKGIQGFNRAVWDEESIVSQNGINIANFWNYTGAKAVGSVNTMIVNSSIPLNTVHPFFIGGIPDQTMQELIWDRLFRVSPDGLPAPWAAESYAFTDDRTLEVVLRQGMTFHDGSPVTVEDVIFSFEVPNYGSGDKVLMYKPLVADIERIERVGEWGVRFHLMRPNAAFLTATLCRMNIVPKHIWEPLLERLDGTPDDIGQVADPLNIGSGPFRQVRLQPSEEAVLDRFEGHFAPPAVERFVMRIITNTDAVIDMLASGQLNLINYDGDPDVIEQVAANNPNVETVSEVDIGFDFVAFNHRRAPFDNVVFRSALSAAIDREVILQAAWSGFAVRSVSHISPALTEWYADDIAAPPTGADVAREILQDAGYVWVDGRLHYPAGVTESLAPGE